ncbi:MAG TPA: crossover junction endodeoxyribonuclease RuvC [Candidatus Paceibacterota bacterium]|nr:crossover junction endodeoxyribonuclease RuvC [Candidatus Paceibacterota bacterium]
MTSTKSTRTLHKVLAFDPGYERLGAAVIEKNGKERLLYSDCIRTSATVPFAQRLSILGKEVEKLIKKFKPDAVALEEVYFEKNAKTAMQIAEVRGMLTYIAASHNISISHFTPLQVKVAITGYGKSDKKAVEHMVTRLLPLPPRKRLDDELDAIAVGLTYMAASRYPHR